MKEIQTNGDNSQGSENENETEPTISVEEVD